MSLSCSCPETVLEAIVIESCQQHIGQIQKLYFQKVGYSWPNATTDPTAKADWDLLIAAVDSTKVIITPLIDADPIIEAGGVVTKGGGDNSTINGVELITAVNPAKFSAKFEGLSAAEIRQLRKLMCKGTLGVYMVNDQGNILMKLEEGSLDYKPIPIRTFGVAAKANEGFGSFDNNEIFFSMDPDYDETLAFVTPADFDALVDLDVTV